MQSRASLVQSTVAFLWLAAAVLFGGWASQSQDIGWIMYTWPGPLVILASACALTGAILTVLTIVMAPAVWRGGRRVESWTPWRKLRFTVTTVIFAVFSLMLGAWGALAPWSG
jgi:hypothetical protein